MHLWDEVVGHWLWYAGWRSSSVGSLLVALGLAAWGWQRRAEGTGRLLLVVFGLSAALLLAYGGWQAGFPAPSSL